METTTQQNDVPEKMAAIIILGLPRSGSSMVAGIFALHGVWVGTCKLADTHNPKGYFENIFFREYMQKNYPTVEAIEKIMVSDGYKGGPWLWKVLSLNQGEFDQFDPAYICCRRPSQQIFDSMRSSKVFGHSMSDVALKNLIETRQECLEGHEIETDELANGNFDAIQAALFSVGLVPDTKLIEDFVDQSLWHYHS